MTIGIVIIVTIIIILMARQCHRISEVRDVMRASIGKHCASHAQYAMRPTAGCRRADLGARHYGAAQRAVPSRQHAQTTRLVWPVKRYYRAYYDVS